MKSIHINLAFILSLCMLASSALFTVFGLITGRKYEEIRTDFETAMGPPGDTLADFYLWLSGQPDQLIPGSVWMLGIPLIASAVTGLTWFRFRLAEKGRQTTLLDK